MTFSRENGKNLKKLCMYAELYIDKRCVRNDFPKKVSNVRYTALTFNWHDNDMTGIDMTTAMNSICILCG